MGLVRTMGRFCYIECDDQQCTKKIEHIDENILKQLARLCKWEGRGQRWLCPDCAEKEPPVKRARKAPASRKKRSKIRS